MQKRAFNESHHLLMIKHLSKMGTKATSLNIIKTIYNKPLKNKFKKNFAKMQPWQSNQ